MSVKFMIVFDDLSMKIGQCKRVWSCQVSPQAGPPEIRVEADDVHVREHDWLLNTSLDLEKEPLQKLLLEVGAGEAGVLDGHGVRDLEKGVELVIA